jgi:hypothetical protein
MLKPCNERSVILFRERKRSYTEAEKERERDGELIQNDSRKLFNRKVF